MEIMWKTTMTKRRLVIAAIALMGLGLVTTRLAFVDPAQAKQAVVLVQKGGVIKALALADSHDLASLRLLFGRIRDDDAALLLLSLFNAAHDHAVKQRFQIHCSFLLKKPPNTGGSSTRCRRPSGDKSELAG